MNSKAAAAYHLCRLFQQHPENTLAFIVWLVVAAIDTAIISAVIAYVISNLGKVSFSDAFKPIFIIVAIIHVIFALIMLLS